MPMEERTSAEPGHIPAAAPLMESLRLMRRIEKQRTRESDDEKPFDQDPSVQMALAALLELPGSPLKPLQALEATATDIRRGAAKILTVVSRLPESPEAVKILHNVDRVILEARRALQKMCIAHKMAAGEIPVAKSGRPKDISYPTVSATYRYRSEPLYPKPIPVLDPKRGKKPQRESLLDEARWRDTSALVLLMELENVRKRQDGTILDIEGDTDMRDVVRILVAARDRQDLVDTYDGPSMSLTEDAAITAGYLRLQARLLEEGAVVPPIVDKVRTLLAVYGVLEGNKK